MKITGWLHSLIAARNTGKPAWLETHLQRRQGVRALLEKFAMS